MRTAIVSAFLALGLICAANPAAAQSQQSSVPSHLFLPENTLTNKTASPVTTAPAHLDSRYTLPANSRDALGSLGNQATKPNIFSDQQRRTFPPQGRLHAQTLPSADTCAHILIHRVWSPDSNPMVVEPKGSADRIPSAKGLPVCREDIR